VRERVDLAKRLNEGECGGSYAEAILILSALLSGIAADLWPGKGKDRKRFVQLWASHADPHLNPNHVGVPFLVDHLDAEGPPGLAEKVRSTRPGAFMPAGISDALVVTGAEVDQAETGLRALDQRLTPDLLREFSYGKLFYDHLRSGYTHEYHTTEHASPRAQATEPAPISYVNFASGRNRRIYFDIEWVAELVESVSSSAVPLRRQAPFQDPVPWWVEG
jgi:hypothetical protein